MKTVKQDEPIARSRFSDCPVCKNHTLKVKKTVQVGRCKTCNETYKVIVVFVKTQKKQKLPPSSLSPHSENRLENRPEQAETPPSWQPPIDTPSFGSSGDPYAGLSEALFGKPGSEQKSESGSGGGQ